MKQIFITGLLVMLSSSTVLAAKYDERSLGKLFTSPAERQSIDSSKRGESPQVTSRRIVPSSVKIDGVVIRSKGKNTVWMNGNKTSANETVDGVKVFSTSTSKDNIKIPVLVDGKSVKIKPGQSWSDETGAVVDSY